MARMFPAYKPSEILTLPTKYYLAMREYYVHVKTAEAKAMAPSQSYESDIPPLTVVDFDKSSAVGKPI